jgi:bisanhydrobacterioruberin hydratase
MLNFPEYSAYSSISTVFIILFALPSYYSLVQHLGFRKGILVLFVFSVIPILVEMLAVLTGFPYGGFVYGESLGWLLFDIVPLVVSLAYLPILLGSLFYASRKNNHLFLFILISSIFNMFVDLVIDPAAVHIGFWSYDFNGIYYGVPFSNFLGWLVTGLVYSALFYLLVGKENLPLPSGMSVSLIWILSFWTGYLLLAKLYIPFILGVILYIFLILEYDGSENI